MPTAQFTHKYTEIDTAVTNVFGAIGEYDTLEERIEAGGGGQIEMDDTPTEGSTNAVTSDGIWQEFQRVWAAVGFSNSGSVTAFGTGGISDDIITQAEEVTA